MGGEVSLLGDAPVPHDRPFGFLESGDGGNVWADIGMQIALSFVDPLVSAAATALVGWIGWQWQRVLAADFDANSADALHKALERGMLAAIDALGSRASRDKKLAAGPRFESVRTHQSPYLTRSELVLPGRRTQSAIASAQRAAFQSSGGLNTSRARQKGRTLRRW